MRALILAGGKGSRLRPLTDTRPKPLIPFMGEPLAAGLLRRLRAAGCGHATLLVGAGEAPFAGLRPLGEALGIEVSLVTEETPLDTAGAVRRAVRELGEPVLVCNGDILTDLDYGALWAAHLERGDVATLALARVADPTDFGVAVTGPGGAISAFVEKPAPGSAPADTINAGVYVVDPSAFAAFGGDGPLSFERDVFPGLLRDGRGLGGHVTDAYWSDLGTPERYRAGHADVLAGRCRWPGDPALVAAPGGGAVHRTAAVAVGALVDEASVVCAGARVGERAQLRGSVVLEGAEVGDGATVSASVLGASVRIGAGARVHGNAVLGDGARVAPGCVLPEGARIAPGAVVAA